MTTAQSSSVQGAEASPFGEPPDFSLVLGGPTYQLLRRARLEGGYLELLYRRLIVIPLFAWLPLFLLSVFRSMTGDAGRLSFFQDVEVHVKFLVALPVLIVAEVVVHSRLRPIARRFLERHIIFPEDVPGFHRALDSAISLRNSVPLELGLLALVYTFGLWFWHNRFSIQVVTWFALPGGRWHLTPAGIWYVFISIPLLQFILLRWYLRFFIWYRMLWQISRMQLNLIPTHPDRAGGIGFIGTSAYALSPIVFAQGAMLTGLIASRVLYHGENLMSFKLQALGFVAFFVCGILGPLVMFTPRMSEAKRKGLAEYGLLASRYVEGFREKWVAGTVGSSEELLGNSDIQSLADLGSSYDVVREMRVVPFSLQDITRLAAVAAAPMIPLLFTVWTPEEVILKVFKVVF
jgi:hypothetical protein